MFHKCLCVPTGVTHVLVIIALFSSALRSYTAGAASSVIPPSLPIVSVSEVLLVSVFMRVYEVLCLALCVPSVLCVVDLFVLLSPHHLVLCLLPSGFTT